MNQKTRIFIAVLSLFLIVGLVLGVDALRRRSAALQAPADMPPGSIPIFVDGEFAASFVPEDLEKLDQASFVDGEEGKTQEGWLLEDVLRLYLDAESLRSGAEIRVSSSSREKSAELTWAQVDDPENMVLFDLSGRGTLKLASQMEGLDTRDLWVQDVDRIEVQNP